MTDRIKGCVVAFDHDIRDDDAQGLLNAIRMIKGVQSVTTKQVNADDWMNRQRIRLKLSSRLLKVLYPVDPDDDDKAPVSERKNQI